MLPFFRAFRAANESNDDSIDSEEAASRSIIDGEEFGWWLLEDPLLDCIITMSYIFNDHQQTTPVLGSESVFVVVQIYNLLQQFLGEHNVSFFIDYDDKSCKGII